MILLICINNDINPASLILGKVYRTLADAEAKASNMLRIIAVHAPTLRTQPHADWIAWAGPDEPRLQVTLRRTARTAATLLHLDCHPSTVPLHGCVAGRRWPRPRPLAYRPA